MSTPSGIAAGRDQVHLHALCWNEARMIPYFLHHYRDIVARFFVYDGGSTDGSLAKLAGDERVRVIPWELTGDSVFEAARGLSNACWKQSRGAAEWVFLVDMNEHLFHPEMLDVLRNAASDGATAIKVIGYDMVADAFPGEDQVLAQTVTRGVRMRQLDRMAVFNPDAVLETNFAVGRHAADPTGQIVWETRHPIALLQYERLGTDYVCERNEALLARLRPGDIARNYGLHHRISREGVAAQQLVMARAALPVPFLGGAATAGGKHDLEQEKALLRQSGLFQGAWYLERYPDVAAAGIDPLDHFCRNGWREGRRPNSHFDPGWYMETYGELIGDVNPLVDYVLGGEDLGRKPEPAFDPMDYRFSERLPCAESPLRHRLRAEADAGASA